MAAVQEPAVANAEPWLAVSGHVDALAVVPAGVGGERFVAAGVSNFCGVAALANRASPGGAPLLFSGSDEGRLDAWEVSLEGDSQALTHLDGKQGHDHLISCIASNSTSSIATGSWDCAIRLWDSCSLSCIGSPLRGHNGYVTDACKSSDADFFSSSMDATVRRWDTRTPKCVALWKADCPVYCVRQAPHEANTAVVGTQTGQLLQIDFRKLEGVFCIPRHHSDCVQSISFDSSGTRIASSGDDGRVIVQSISGNDAGDTLELAPHEPFTFVRASAWDHTDKFVFTGGWDGKILNHNISA